MIRTTRSSSRQVRSNEIVSDSRLKLLEGKNRRTRTKASKPNTCFSDDSENDNGTFKGKLLNNVTKTPATNSDIAFIDDSEECRSLYNENSGALNLSTPRKQKLQTCNMQEVNCASPPKQSKIINEDILRTPQHKIEQNKDVHTPCRLMSEMKLTSPTSNTSLNKSCGLNRKELFKEDNKKSMCTENHEHSAEQVVTKSKSIYQIARKALNNTFPTDMPGRERELNELREFIKTCIKSGTSGSLYISGPPGTGKSASLNIILQEDNISSELQKVYINCTAIKSPSAIYSRIVKELGIKVTGKSEKCYLSAVQNYLQRQSKMTLLVLDEIDQLENKNQSILYTIFEWPSKPNYRLILVGIANALDLTDRKLQRLQGHCELKPKLMHFAPYTKQQILQIFTARLKSAGALEVFSPVALQMLATKFAAGSGDIRRALDVGRRAIELIDETKTEEVLKPVENLAAELVDKEEKQVHNKLKAVDLNQVVRVLNKVFGTSQNLIEDTDNTFPLQQKIILCSLILMLKKAKNKDITIGKLHEVYKRVCIKRNISHIDQAEFVGLCSLIEARGIIRIIRKKEPRLNKVNLEWDEEEVADVLKDKQLMSVILQDESCLTKI